MPPAPLPPTPKLSNQQHNDLLHSLLDSLENRFTFEGRVNRSLVSLLHSLATHLQVHFEWDECDVNFDGLERRAPELAEEIQQLKKEQSELLHDVDKLIALASLAFAEGEGAKSLQNYYQSFQRHFAEHEATEKELLQRALSIHPDCSE